METLNVQWCCKEVTWLILDREAANLYATILMEIWLCLCNQIETHGRSGKATVWNLQHRITTPCINQQKSLMHLNLVTVYHYCIFTMPQFSDCLRFELYCCSGDHQGSVGAPNRIHQI